MRTFIKKYFEEIVSTELSFRDNNKITLNELVNIINSAINCIHEEMEDFPTEAEILEFVMELSTEYPILNSFIANRDLNKYKTIEDELIIDILKTKDLKILEDYIFLESPRSGLPFLEVLEKAIIPFSYKIIDTNTIIAIDFTNGKEFKDRVIEMS